MVFYLVGFPCFSSFPFLFRWDVVSAVDCLELCHVYHILIVQRQQVAREQEKQDDMGGSRYSTLGL